MRVVFYLFLKTKKCQILLYRLIFFADEQTSARYRYQLENQQLRQRLEAMNMVGTCCLYGSFSYLFSVPYSLLCSLYSVKDWMDQTRWIRQDGSDRMDQTGWISRDGSDRMNQTGENRQEKTDRTEQTKKNCRSE